MGGRRCSRDLRKQGLPGSRIREMASQSGGPGSVGADGWTEFGVQAVLERGAIRQGRPARYFSRACGRDSAHEAWEILMNSAFFQKSGRLLAPE